MDMTSSTYSKIETNDKINKKQQYLQENTTKLKGDKKKRLIQISYWHNNIWGIHLTKTRIAQI